jgi:two-component system KDP operon response regulator KdpE
MPSEPPLILVVEDDAVLRNVTCITLAAGSYRVIEAETGQQALAVVAAQHPDAILLDLGLPDMDGLDVIRQIHDSPMPPIIVFSAREFENDKVAAFDAGAIDFMAKPFVAGDLLHRVHSVLKRSSRSTTYRVGELTVDIGRLEVTLRNERVKLTQTELRLLLALAGSAGNVVTNRQLINAVWGPDSASESMRLRIYIGQLRHKIESDPARPRYLQTESGVGYRLADE